MVSIGKSVAIAIVALLLFAGLAHFVSFVLFGAVIYAWIATILAIYCLMIESAQRHALVRFYCHWTCGHVLLHAGFVVMLLMSGHRIVALAYAAAVGLWLLRSGKLWVKR